MAEFIAEQVIHLGEETNEKRGETPVSRQKEIARYHILPADQWLLAGLYLQKAIPSSNTIFLNTQPMTRGSLKDTYLNHNKEMCTFSVELTSFNDCDLWWSVILSSTKLIFFLRIIEETCLLTCLHGHFQSCLTVEGKSSMNEAWSHGLGVPDWIKNRNRRRWASIQYTTLSAVWLRK